MILINTTCRNIWRWLLVSRLAIFSKSKDVPNGLFFKLRRRPANDSESSVTECSYSFPTKSINPQNDGRWKSELVCVSKTCALRLRVRNVTRLRLNGSTELPRNFLRCPSQPLRLSRSFPGETTGAQSEKIVAGGIAREGALFTALCSNKKRVAMRLFSIKQCLLRERLCLCQQVARSSSLLS